MSEPATPIGILGGMKFSIASFENLHPRGSYEREQARLMARGLQDELDWVIANLERAGEGKSNYGLTRYAGQAEGAR